MGSCGGDRLALLLQTEMRSVAKSTTASIMTLFSKFASAFFIDNIDCWDARKKFMIQSGYIIAKLTVPVLERVRWTNHYEGNSLL